MMGLPSLPRLGRRGQTNIGNSGVAAVGAAKGGGCCVGGIMGGTGAIEVIREVPPPLPPPLTPLALVPQLLLLLLLLPLPTPLLDSLETIDWAPIPEAPSAPAVTRKRKYQQVSET